MRIGKAATPVETYRLLAIARPHKHCMTTVLVTVKKIFHHLTAQPFALIGWGNSQVLQFANAFTFQGDDGYCKRLLCLFVQHDIKLPSF